MKFLAKLFWKLGFFGKLLYITVAAVQFFYSIELCSYMMNLASTIANLLGFLFLMFDGIFLIRLAYFIGLDKISPK
jgi:hypothetical protein